MIFGFDASLEVRDAETSFRLADSILAEPSGSTRARLDPAWADRVGRPEGLRCGREEIEGLRPARAFESRLGEPGGFVGAFRDRDDRWDAGWAVWSSDME